MTTDGMPRALLIRSLIMNEQSVFNPQLSEPRVNDTNVTARVARECAAFRAAELDEETRHRVRMLILDTLGVMLAAARPELPGTQHMLEYAGNEGTGRNRIIGSSMRAGSTTAATANGYLAYALDSDALYRPAIMHVGVAVLPAALAAAEAAGASGRDLLTAIVLGIEVACRASEAIGPADLYARGHHPTAVGGAFGAAVAAGHLLGLSADGMERAIGLAATQSAGLLAWTSDITEESRPFSAGLASRNGIVAAMLAAAGFGGPRGVLDPAAKYNVYRTWSLDAAGSPNVWDGAMEQGGRATQLVYKRHGCCGFLHPAVDAVLELTAEYKLTRTDFAGMTMRFASAGASVIDANPLRSHSAQYVLPLAAALGKVDFDDVLRDRTGELHLDDENLRTKVVYDKDLDAVFPATRTTIMEITTRDGRTLSKKVVAAKGSPENPMSDDDLKTKFVHMAGRRLPTAAVHDILQMVMAIEDEASLDRLFGRLMV